MEFPTDFNGQVKLVLDHATGADILTVLTRHQKFAANRLESSLLQTLEGSDPAAGGRLADSQAQVFELNMLFADICATVTERLTSQEQADHTLSNSPRQV